MVTSGEPVSAGSGALYRRRLTGTLDGWTGTHVILTVQPGVLTCEAERGELSRPLVHRTSSGSNEVVLIRARLFPPWMDLHLLMQEDGGQALINVAGNRRILRRCLQDAGFAIVERRTWVSNGSSLIKNTRHP